MRRANVAFTCMLVVLLLAVNVAWAQTEQIVNGGFETGDFTGWTITEGSPEVTSQEAYSGVYSACLPRDENVTSRIKQILSGYPVAQITSLTFAAKIENESGGSFTVKFYYSDGSTYEDTELVADNLWNAPFDVTEFLDPEKTLSGIEFYMAEPGTLYIDDVSLLVVISGGVQPSTPTPPPQPKPTPTPSGAGGIGDFLGNIVKTTREALERLLGNPWLLLLVLLLVAGMAYMARRG